MLYWNLRGRVINLLVGMALIAAIDIPRVELVDGAVADSSIDLGRAFNESLLQAETPSETQSLPRLREGLLATDLAESSRYPVCVFVCSGSSGWWRSVGGPFRGVGLIIFELLPLASSGIGSPF
jgi:hypothetical protein